MFRHDVGAKFYVYNICTSTHLCVNMSVYTESNSDKSIARRDIAVSGGRKGSNHGSMMILRLIASVVLSGFVVFVRPHLFGMDLGNGVFLELQTIAIIPPILMLRGDMVVNNDSVDIFPIYLPSTHGSTPRQNVNPSRSPGTGLGSDETTNRWRTHGELRPFLPSQSVRGTHQG